MARVDSDSMDNEAGVSYGELIRRQRKIKKLSQEELGALVRVKKNAVGAWEAGRSRPDISSVPVICRALDLSLEEFFGIQKGDPLFDGIEPSETARLIRQYSALNEYNREIAMREMSILKEMQNKADPSPRKVVRLYRNDLAVSAGTGETLETDHGEAVYLFADLISETADEIIRVNGDSMEPTYLDGDFVFLMHTTSLREGEIGVFIIGDAGYIKEYRKDGLYSHNPAYPPMKFSRDPEETEVRCIGRVLGRVKARDWADEEDFRAWETYSQKGR